MRRVDRLRRWLDPKREDGLTLVMVLGILVFFSATTVTAVTMSRSTQDTAVNASSGINAYALAEAGVNAAQSVLYYQNSNAGNPSAANLLGCNGATSATDQNGPSNCSV